MSSPSSPPQPAAGKRSKKTGAEDVLVGQALKTANLCAECGEALAFSVKTGEPCDPKSPDAHEHEHQPVYGGGTVPICCACRSAATEVPCPEIERAGGTQPKPRVKEATTA